MSLQSVSPFVNSHSLFLPHSVLIGGATTRGLERRGWWAAIRHKSSCVPLSRKSKQPLPGGRLPFVSESFSYLATIWKTTKVTVYFCSIGVTAEMLRPFLEGWTVKQIVDAKRLFVVDHKILEDLPTRNDRPVSVRLPVLCGWWNRAHAIDFCCNNRLSFVKMSDASVSLSPDLRAYRSVLLERRQAADANRNPVVSGHCSRQSRESQLAF